MRRLMVVVGTIAFLVITVNSSFALSQENNVRQFNVAVNYNRTLGEMIAAAGYNYVDNEINARNVVFSGNGIENVTIRLVRITLREEMSLSEVLNELARQDMRPATLPELLALTERRPELLKQCDIAALGSVVHMSNGYLAVPLAGRSVDAGGDEQRVLTAYYLTRDFYNVIYFAAVSRPRR